MRAIIVTPRAHRQRRAAVLSPRRHNLRAHFIPSRPNIKRRSQRNRSTIPVRSYEPLANELNPVKFNADAWVKLARDAGMKYIVITSKHHDGFALFKSKVSPYSVVDATPFKRVVEFDGPGPSPSSDRRILEGVTADVDTADQKNRVRRP